MVAWIEQYGQIIGFFIQLAFYIVVAVSALWAAIMFAKYVRFMTTEDEDVADSGGSSDKSKDKDEDALVDEFVE